jgi:hypothetical protein
LEKYVASIFRIEEWFYHNDEGTTIPPKQHLSTILHSIISQKTEILILIAVKASNVMHNDMFNTDNNMENSIV